MSKMMFSIILIVVSINVLFLFVYMNKPTETTTQNNSNVSSNQNPTIVNQSQANLSLIYVSNCVNSTKNQAKNLENITNVTEIETRIFDKENDTISYLSHNWSNSFYDINGTQKDMKNKTVVSIFEIMTNRGRNFTIPIICDINGSMGNYSSCLLNSIPDIPSACYNLTINMSDCENEWANHFILDDIQYWISPGSGTIIIPSTGYNISSQVFNFTINSTRQRLESYGMEITERTFSPMKDMTIFSSTKMSKDGKGGSIAYNVSLAGKRGVEYYSTAWFVKKCYDKYVIY